MEKPAVPSNSDPRSGTSRDKRKCTFPADPVVVQTHHRNLADDMSNHRSPLDSAWAGFTMDNGDSVGKTARRTWLGLVSDGYLADGERSHFAA